MRNLGHVCLYFLIDFTYPILKSNWGLSEFVTAVLLFTIFYLGVLYVCIFITEGLDLFASPDFKRKYKIQDERKSIHSQWEIFEVGIRNEVVQFIVIFTLFYYYLNKYDNPSDYYSFIPRQVVNFFWNIVCFVIFDFVMYYGHVWMHNTKEFKSVHQGHHETFATSGLSSHFMSTIDFFIESIGILMAYIMILIPLGCPVVPIIQFASYGIYNTVFVHSGWNFPFAPDPYPHYLHHLKYRVNYGIGIFDRIHSTALEWSEMKN